MYKQCNLLNHGILSLNLKVKKLQYFKSLFQLTICLSISNVVRKLNRYRKIYKALKGLCYGQDFFAVICCIKKYNDSLHFDMISHLSKWLQNLYWTYEFMDLSSGNRGEYQISDAHISVKKRLNNSL